uniref:Putative O-antigen ligase n=1 Tax=viral metagenome TaxID=1070528 RepID=A0A6M3KGP4_9ZZZZ
MCVLQFFDIAQFFQFINSSDPQFPRYWNNLVTGFIGNGTHLSGFLGMCVPLLFLRWKRENLFILILILLILTQTGTNKNDPSASGFAIIICISYYYLYFKNRKAFWWSTLAGLISVSVLFCVLKETTWFIKFIRPTGRMEIWSYYWPLFKKYTITGTGLGTVNQIFKQGIGAPNTRHLHLEYYHFALETGIIGLVLIGNLFKEFFSVKDSGNTTIVLKAIILGFLLNCLFNFPAHLWLPSVYALFAYAGVYTIENERILKYGYFDEKRSTGQCIKYNPTGCFPDR